MCTSSGAILASMRANLIPMQLRGPHATKRHVADTGMLCLLLRSKPEGRVREGGIDQSVNDRKERICHHDISGGESTFLGQISLDLSSTLG